MLVFHQADEHGDANSEEQSDGKFEPIVRVELEFGQKVAAGDTEKRAGAKRQGAAKEDGIGRSNMICANIEKHDAERCGEGKQGVEEMPGRPRTSPGGHQCGNSHGIKGFVQDDSQGGAEASRPLPFRRHYNCRRKRQSIEQRMQCQAEGSADPG